MIVDDGVGRGVGQFLAVSRERKGRWTVAIEDRTVEILELAVVEVVRVIGNDVGDELVRGDAEARVVGDA